MLLIAAEIVPIFPFQPLCDDSFPGPDEWCIPHRVRGSLTIGRGLRCLIGDLINFATSACHLRFRLHLCEEVAMLKKIGGGCS